MDCSLDGFVDSTIELPVLQPPPGFEDGSPCVVEDHYYDDPYCEDIELDFKPLLNIQAISSFANNLAQSILTSVVVSHQPRVKMRTKKPLAIPQQQQQQQQQKQSLQSECDFYSVPIDSLNVDKRQQLEINGSKNRHSIAVPQNTETSEPIHMTLEEVRSYLREFQDTSSSQRRRPWMIVPSKSVESTTSDSKRKSCFVWTPHMVSKNNSFDDARTKRSRKSLSVTAAGIKQALFSVFRISTQHHFLSHQPHDGDSSRNQVCPTGWTFSTPEKSEIHHPSSAGNSPHQRRALPPVPQEPVGFVRVPSRPPPSVLPPPPTGDIQHLDLAGNVPNCGPSSFETPVNCLSEGSLDLADNHNHQDSALDFAASIEAVKDHGWYWGPLSGDAAEKILSTEPDGSFLVRDSSDDHYIFSLSFKLNGGVRHVRIEHDHGNFSFGSVARFRSQTMVEFIDKAIEHSRSGRFLFFLHRRPTHGPTRVQLLHPVSRFRQVQSLQHLSRFVILKFVRRDQISLLPLPTRLREYLNTAHYYSEQLVNGTTSQHSP